MPIVLKSANLNLLEPSGPVQVCNGIALPLLLLLLLLLLHPLRHRHLADFQDSTHLTDQALLIHCSAQTS